MRAFDRPAYLGLDDDAHWQRLVAEGLQAYGTHYAGSRRASYCPMVYAELEGKLAAWLDAPATLTVASGSWLAVQLVDLLQARGYTVLAGPDAHVAWLRPGVAGFAEAQLWKTEALRLAASGRMVAVVSDRVNPIRCGASDLSWWAELPATACLVVDDSHALGVLGAKGRGSWAEFGALSAHLLVCASLGKAFSVPGAVLVGSMEWLTRIETSASYGGASALPPAYAHALHVGLIYALGRRERLLGFVAVIEALGLVHAPGHPAFRISAVQGEALRAAGIEFARLAYPRAESVLVERLVLSAGHSEVDVARVVEVLRG